MSQVSSDLQESGGGPRWFGRCQDYVWVVDRRGRVVDANPAACRASGARLAAWVGEPLSQRFRRIDKGRATLLGPDGPVRSLYFTECALHDVSQPAVEEELRLIHAWDVGTGSERERQAPMARIIRAQEDERARVARELHDSLGQILTSLSLGMTAALSDGEDRPDPDQCVRLRSLIQIAIGETSRLARGLRPLDLEELGLEVALQEMARRLSGAAEVEIQVAVQTEGVAPRLSSEVEMALYRMAQEALNNAVKHAQATQIVVLVHLGPDEVRLLVEDNGVGLAEPAEGERGLGLGGLRDRAALLGGRVQLESTPGCGTTLAVRVPLGEAEETAFGTE